jgi:hypothetical protein
MPRKKNPAAVALGKLGGAKGGAARAAATGLLSHDVQSVAQRGPFCNTTKTAARVSRQFRQSGLCIVGSTVRFMILVPFLLVENSATAKIRPAVVWLLCLYLMVLGVAPLAVSAMFARGDLPLGLNRWGYFGSLRCRCFSSFPVAREPVAATGAIIVMYRFSGRFSC